LELVSGRYSNDVHSLSLSLSHGRSVGLNAARHHFKNTEYLIRKERERERERETEIERERQRKRKRRERERTEREKERE
jgi:hypothetical protein